MITLSALPKIGSSCELDVDCKTLLNSRCHHGSCSCDAGYRLLDNTCRSPKGAHGDTVDKLQIFNYLIGFN